MKTLTTLVLATSILLSTPAMALKGLDTDNKESMQMLGKFYACELHFADIGEQRKSDVIAIATGEEFEADWNVMRNDTMIESMTQALYKLNQGSVKGLETCNKIYKLTLDALQG